MAKPIAHDALPNHLDALNQAGRVHWQHQDDAITCQIHFVDFVSAFAFMTAVALHAEKMNHHPEWRNVYNQVSIRLRTHDVNAISDLDFRLAEIITVLATNYPTKANP